MRIKCTKCGEMRIFGRAGLEKRVQKQGIKLDSFKKSFTCKWCDQKNKIEQMKQPVKKEVVKKEKKK